MRSASFITKIELSKNKVKREIFAAIICLLVLVLANSVSAQTVAVLTPEPATKNVYADILADELSERLTILDSSLVISAYSVSRPAYPFNMTTDEAKTAAAAIGCDFLLLVRTETQRRTSLERPEYYESTAAIYVVSSRTGHLVYWNIRSLEAASPAESESKLRATAISSARELATTIKDAQKKEIIAPRPQKIEEPPLPGTPEAKGFVAPIPYRRIKPDYTTMAYLYSVAATVEILVDLDAVGKITRTEIVRWAGYGLDESVESAVRTMNWRPAERNKRALPMRVLLRYNFKKADAKP